jgi:predicted small secreted protein
MRKFVLVAAVVLAASHVSAPASAQGVGIYVGPGGAGVTVGPQGPPYAGQRYYDDRPRGYYREGPPVQRCRTIWVDRGGWTERVRTCDY